MPSHWHVRAFLGIGAVLVGTGLLSSQADAAGGSVKPKVLHEKSFTVVGIAARTSNAKEMTAEGLIGKIWSRMTQEGLLAQIPNKADGNIVAVYTDYASDHDGEYTYVLGAKVKDASRIPEGMVAKTIPAGKYAMFTSERGPAYQVVPKAWQRINALPKTEIGADRTYRADFEIYDKRAQNSDDVVVDVYVGIR
jgi:predicted transcriptional regulator YdeE